MPVNGGWGGWGAWSTCDSRTRRRENRRDCNSPFPENDGLDCSGSSQKQESCQEGIVFHFYTSIDGIEVSISCMVCMSKWLSHGFWNLRPWVQLERFLKNKIFIG